MKTFEILLQLECYSTVCPGIHKKNSTSLQTLPLSNFWMHPIHRIHCNIKTERSGA